MRYYCPHCWYDSWNENFTLCPRCGYRVNEFDQQDYVDKLINALGHHAGEVRHWAVMILAQRKEKRAIPYLERLQLESKDPSLVKAAEEAVKKIVSQED